MTETAAVRAAAAERQGLARRALGLAVLAVFVAALNLRVAMASVSPLVDTIRADAHLSPVGVSLLTAIPTLAMGAGAPLATLVGRRWGLHTGVLTGLMVIGVGTGLRALGHQAWLQLVCAAAAGVGIALAQTLLPAVVRARFADRVGLMTGVYTVGIGLSAVAATGVSVHLAHALDSWPLALGSWAVLAVIAAALWLACRRQLDLNALAATESATTGPVTTGPVTTGPATVGLPWHSRTAWRITLITAGNSALYYCELAWLAPLLHSDGHRSEPNAANLLTVMLCIQVVCMLAIPAALGDRRDRRIGLVATTLLLGGGFLGFAFAPHTGTWVWLILMGVGHGGFFPLVLTLPAAMRDPAQSRQVSGMSFFIGYGCAAAAPPIIGWLHDLSGNYGAGFAVLGAIAVVSVVPIVRLPAGPLDLD